MKSGSIAFLAVLLLLLKCFPSEACSTYKVTAFGNTKVGTNYDTWLLNPVLWFETKGYGCYFTGARPAGNGMAPQTGMNIHGLSYVTLGAPEVNGTAPIGKKQITDRSAYLKDILHTCKTVEEVKAYVDQYDHSSLFGEIFMYVDSTGNYLVVEPYATVSGSDAKYVLANFCPSTITDFSTIPQVRYKNGVRFRNGAIDSSLAFCTAMSDTMHVCRERIGDGTLLTSILDLNRGNVTLYFYHDYAHHYQFNLQNELTKGDHQLDVVGLFPPNKEYEALVSFSTPFNSETLSVFLWSCAFLFGASAFVFLFAFFRSKGKKYRGLMLWMFPLSLVTAFYMLTLLRIENIYYFPSPYEDYKFSIVNIVAYTPFLVLLLIVPFLLVNRSLFRQQEWKPFTKWLFATNTLSYLLLIMMFSYWGLYNVF